MGWKRKRLGDINVPIEVYLEELIKVELKRALPEDITVCIGTDSQKYHKGYKFATAIILVTKGKGGKVMSKTHYEKTRIDIVERMTKEVNMSIMCAYSLIDLLNKYKVNIEIHADINQNPRHKSNLALKSAINYINSMAGFFTNYSYKVKPDAWAASTGADKLCK